MTFLGDTRGAAMSTVVMHAVVSVDGYIADENDEVGPLFDWYFNGTEPLVDEPAEQLHSPFRVSAISQSYVRPFWSSIRVMIQGRHLFDLTDAVGEARRLAGDGVVALCAGDVGGRALALGLVDVVAMDVVPVVFGRG